MTPLYIILLLLGFLCFVAAAFAGDAVSTTGRRRFGVNLVALGLAFWILVPLIVQIRAA